MTAHAQEQITDVCRGIVGITAPVLGVTVSALAEIEQWLRIASLTGGLVVCALTIRSLLRKRE
ncbi:hypothetical protein [Prosthecobacter dejongeii]|uniref:Uncharacterized protein n=1 Tax=Prosthecobacter dejongeii TaxID=48465 RepID=A0A7W7YJR0_9BACT|nr:hypothetical protein [Prosthecobacter dejongeii]MBB5037436.1 hypothetical protein [Prosthecobacter dejongeii]